MHYQNLEALGHNLLKRPAIRYKFVNWEKFLNEVAVND